MLTNAEMDSRSPFALILLGQPALRRRLRLGLFAALDQRIALRYELSGMNLEETTACVRHDLELAGRPDTLFSDGAIAPLRLLPGGVGLCRQGQQSTGAYARVRTVAPPTGDSS